MSDGTRIPGFPLDALRSASDELVERVRTLAEAVRSTSSSAVTSVAGPVPEAAGDLLHALRAVAQQTPAPTAVLDVLMSEIGAKRALLRGLQAQLAALDDELGILENSLAPVQAWSHQWARVQGALLGGVLHRAPGQPE